MEKPVSKDDVDRQTMPQTKGELIADLKRRGIDPEELKELVVSKGEVTEEEFDQLMDFPEDFLTQLDDWLQSDLLGQDILALTTQSAALQQFALLGRTSAGGRAGSDMQNILTLSDTQPKKEQMSDIIGRLLNEKGGEEGLEEGLSKDKLFEQMLNAKSSDASAKNGLFAGLLGDSITGNLSGLQNTGQGFAGIGVNVAGLNGTPSASGSIPQLPMLRGLPGQPGATEALSERIMMMRTKNLQVAEIKLDPQELGALEVRVKIVNDVASVQFHSPNPGVREALESQIVKLREMMDGAGLSLGDVGVSDQSLSDVPEEAFAGQSSEGGSSGVDSDNGDVESIDGATVMAHAKQSIGLVDYFA
jgi:flagellar hook-length control protein FliK